MKYTVVEELYKPSSVGGTTGEFAWVMNNLADDFNLVPVVYHGETKGFSFFKAISYFENEIKKVKPDLVVIRGAEKDGLAAIIGARRAGVKRILVGIHGLYREVIKAKSIYKLIDKVYVEPRTFQLCSGFYTVSNYAWEKFSFLHKYSTKYRGTLYNAKPDYSSINKGNVRSEIRHQLGISDLSIMISYAGRFTFDKGFGVFGDALENIFKTSAVNYSFVLIGSGPYRSQFEKRFAKEILDKRLIFVDPVSDVSHYLIASDIYVHPSLHENHSMSILEACEAGCFVIATDVGGVAETIVPGLNGTIVSKGNPNELSSELLFAMSNPRKLLSKTNEWSQFGNKFSSENIRIQTKDMYLKEINFSQLERKV